MKKSKKSETIEESKRSVKKSISFSKTVNTWAEEMAEIGGYDNFSAYIADLIRRDRDRERGLALAEKSTDSAAREAEKIKP